MTLQQHFVVSVILACVFPHPIHYTFTAAALHIACRRGVEANIVRFLLNRDKDVRLVKNNRGEYPYDLAKCHGLESDIPDLYDEVMGNERDLHAGSLSSMSMDDSIYSEYMLNFP